MVETAEGIGSRKFSILRDESGTWLMEGAHQIARLTTRGEQVLHLLVTAPQLWDAANEVMKAAGTADMSRIGPAAISLGNMVAKSVNKQDWKEVAQ